MMVGGLILCSKSFLVWLIFIELNVYWMWRKGFGWKSFFVNEVSFKNVAKVIGFIHAFENGEKCNCLFIDVTKRLQALDNVWGIKKKCQRSKK